ncbi:MAG: hypothetical protein AAGI15_00890 [Pseudomonadota bacterium]
MYSIARAFASDVQARNAVAELKEEGFSPNAIRVISLAPSQETEEPVTPQEAMAFGYRLRELDVDKAEDLMDAAINGCSVVLVMAQFGESKAAEVIMDGHNPERLASFIEEYEPMTRWDEAAPLSSAFGLPILIKRTPDPVLLKGLTFESIPALTKPGFTFFGNGVMRDKPAPLSSMFGMKLLSEPKENWNSSFGMPLLKDADKGTITNPKMIKEGAPLSRMFGLPTIIR